MTTVSPNLASIPVSAAVADDNDRQQTIARTGRQARFMNAGYSYGARLPRLGDAGVLSAFLEG
jgi:hypothetical protein